MFTIDNRNPYAAEPLFRTSSRRWAEPTGTVDGGIA